MRKTAIYSRKSRFTGKGESIGSQVEMCRGYVTQHMEGTEIAVYEDEGFSGGNLNRPGFQAMLSDARAGKLGAVVVYRLDRISRSIGDFSGLIEELSHLQVDFISIKEQFDTATPMGRAMMYICSIFSQLERETIAERIRDNLHELARTGRWLGGITPTGFCSEAVSTVAVDGKKRRVCRLKPIPEEERTVRQIFALYAKTGSLTGTEQELLRRGIKSKTGRDYSRFTLKNILQNPVYAAADEDTFRYFWERGAALSGEQTDFDGQHGLMVYHRTEQEKGRAAELLPVEAWIVAVGAHPAFLTGQAWISVQEQLRRNSCKAYHLPRKNEALLTGCIWCTCGGRMYPKLSGRTAPDGKTVFFYVCKTKERTRKNQCATPNLSGNSVDAAIWAQIATIPTDQPYLLELLRRGRGVFARRIGNEESERFDQELAEVQRKQECLVDLLTQVPKENTQIIMERINALQKEKQRIECRIKAVHRETAAVPEDILSMSGWTTGEKREMVRRVIDRVEWNGAEIQLFWNGADMGKE